MDYPSHAISTIEKLKVTKKLGKFGLVPTQLLNLKTSTEEKLEFD